MTRTEVHFRNRRLRQLVREIYEDSPTGCCLHVLVDDRNWGHAAFVARVAAEKRHARCALAAEIMLTMTPRQIAGAVGWLPVRLQRPTVER